MKHFSCFLQLIYVWEELGPQETQPGQASSITNTSLPNSQQQTDNIYVSKIILHLQYSLTLELLLTC